MTCAATSRSAQAQGRREGRRQAADPRPRAADEGGRGRPRAVDAERHRRRRRRSTSPRRTGSTSASLVRDLGATLRCRVELRQLSARDSARVQGGIGSCGRDLCCATFLTDFEPVTIRMAKDQDLPLNPLRISGACGRLMCCLKYEHPLYQQFQATAPAVGERVTTPEGAGRVVGHSVPARRRHRPAGRRRLPLLVLAGLGLRFPPGLRVQAADRRAEAEHRVDQTGRRPGRGAGRRFSAIGGSISRTSAASGLDPGRVGRRGRVGPPVVAGRVHADRIDGQCAVSWMRMRRKPLEPWMPWPANSSLRFTPNGSRSAGTRRRSARPERRPRRDTRLRRRSAAATSSAARGCARAATSRRRRARVGRCRAASRA